MQRALVLKTLASVILVGSLIAPQWATAQEKAPKAEKAAKAARGPRLPAYYRNVVSEEQRAKIYAIYEDYRGKLDDLRAQLRKMEDERDEKISALLTPEQREQVAKLRDAAKSKAAKKGAADTDAAPKSDAASKPAE